MIKISAKSKAANKIPNKSMGIIFITEIIFEIIDMIPIIAIMIPNGGKKIASIAPIIEIIIPTIIFFIICSVIM